MTRVYKYIFIVFLLDVELIIGQPMKIHFEKTLFTDHRIIVFQTSHALWHKLSGLINRSSGTRDHHIQFDIKNIHLQWTKALKHLRSL